MMFIRLDIEPAVSQLRNYMLILVEVIEMLSNGYSDS